MPDFTVPAGLCASPVLLVDGECVVRGANPPAQALWARDLAGRHLGELLADGHDAAQALVREMLRSTSPRPAGALVEDDGTTRRVVVVGCRVDHEARVALRFDVAGAGRFTELTRTIDRMNTEVARRQEVEDELQVLLTTTVADLESANAALRRFASGAAHDLKSPLSTVLGFADLVATHEEVPADLLPLVDRIGNAARRGLGLVDELLADALAVAAHDPPTPVDVAAVMRDVRAQIEDRLDGHELSTGSLPTVLGRRAAVRQVLLNLVANAVVHHGPGVAHVHVDAEPVADDWVIRVTDDGPGIPPADRERVFEQGVRLGDAPGTGYGLAHCRRIVEGLGGALWFDEPGPAGGATACLRLPAAARATG